MQGTVESLTREQCVARLAGQRIGRVSMSRNALPVIVPVTYFQDGANIVFRAPLDASFATLCDGAVIAFEADGLSTVESSGWSVHLVGVASILSRDGGEGAQSARVSLERVTGLQIAATVDQQLDAASSTAKAS
jgi:nitroimidazol reductase NimA-like FMN-containing flavoprotein (pyridoxamine 5'-phosphate oxidase superfamily)